MKAPARLGLYGLVLVAVFAVSGFAASTVVPEETAQSWTEDVTATTDHEGEGAMNAAGHNAHADDASPLGLGIEQDGYSLTAVSAPTKTDTEGELTFTVNGPDGSPVTDFELEHEKELHLIVVREDGQHFQHVHPERNDDGTWMIPWQWDAAGTYRVFADFVPAETGEGITLSTSVPVAGTYEPVAADPVATTTVDGFDVSVEGDLVAGTASELTMTVTREGQPVTELEPYLGAFGHLVALRHGDLAYLHAHPQGDEPQAGETSGPQIVFETTAPTAGRYLLYLDFQVDGQVHTAPLVIDTGADASDSGGGHSDQESETGSEQEEGEGHGH